MSFPFGAPSRPRAPRRAVAAAAAAALLLAGCGNAAPGVVAYVGDTQIKEKQVESAVAALTTTVQEGQTVSTEAVINAMIQGELSAQIARDRKITITDGQREALLKTSQLAPLLNVAGAKTVAYDVADQQIVADKLGAAPYLAEVAKRTVTLNPRYGVLDAKQKVILEGQSGSLSSPAAPAP
ncbi:MAG TPA: hypothetical protein VF635_08665 [Propionibacteriaceae bacterium]